MKPFSILSSFLSIAAPSSGSYLYASAFGADEATPNSKATLLNPQAFGERLVANYPIPLLRRNHEGKVTIQVMVTREGRAAECQILESSGDSIIDAWACKGTERYARFSPVTDKDGAATSGQWSESYTLRLGDPALQCGDCFPFESEG